MPKARHKGRGRWWPYSPPSPQERAAAQAEWQALRRICGPVDIGPGIVAEVTMPSAPLVVEGTVDGTPFYYRARGGSWRVCFRVGGWPEGGEGADWEFVGPDPEEQPTADEAVKRIRKCVTQWRAGQAPRPRQRRLGPREASRHA